MKILRLIRTVFLVVGLVFLGCAAFIFWNTESFLHRTVTATGAVVDNVISYGSRNNSSITYHPKVIFQTADGKSISFTSSVGSYPPSYRVGEAVPVLYDPQQPNDARINSFGSLWVGPVIFACIGIVFVAISGLWILFSRQKKHSQQVLRETGQRITAQITEVGLNTSFTVNGRNPYRITSQWQDPSTNRVYVFHSNNIWFDPTQWIPQSKTINVWIQPQKPSRYFVDTDFLPQAGNE